MVPENVVLAVAVEVADGPATLAKEEPGGGPAARWSERGLVGHVGHCYSDGLSDGRRYVIAGAHDHVVHVVVTSIGWSLEVRRGLEREHARSRVDVKQRGIGTASKGEYSRVAVRVGRVHVARNGLVLCRRERGTRGE